MVEIIEMVKVGCIGFVLGAVIYWLRGEIDFDKLKKDLTEERNL